MPDRVGSVANRLGCMMVYCCICHLCWFQGSYTFYLKYTYLLTMDCFWLDYRIISNISTVLYFFNVPPPRAINGGVPLLETVPLLFQPHFMGMLPWPNSCQTHTFQGFFAGTDNEFTQCACNGDCALYFLNAAPRCSIIGDCAYIRDNTVTLV